MTKEELISHASNEGFSWADGQHDGKPVVFLAWEDERNRDKDMIRLDLAELPNMTWAQVKAKAVNGRDVHHVTRVVGYYSQTRNWNPSKLGELKDRRKGDYSLRGAVE